MSLNYPIISVISSSDAGTLKKHSFDQIFSFGNAYDLNTANPSTNLSIKARVGSRVRKGKYGINIT